MRVSRIRSAAVPRGNGIEKGAGEANDDHKEEKPEIVCLYENSVTLSCFRRSSIGHRFIVQCVFVNVK